METTGIDANHDVSCRSVGIQIETEEASTGQEQTTQAADSVLKSLLPMTKTMRLFGLYFTRESHAAVDSTSQLSWQSLKRCQTWNPARIYATIMLVVIWINTVRYCVIFDGVDTIGPVELLMKLGLISHVLLIVILQTAYYVASHTGSLDRVFHDVCLSTDDVYPKYSRMAKVVTVISWLLTTTRMCSYVYPLFTNGRLNDDSELILIDTFHVSKPYAIIITVVFVVLELQLAASLVFPQATKNIFLRCQQRHFFTILNHCRSPVTRQNSHLYHCTL